MVEEGIEGLSIGKGMLNWMYYVRPENSKDDPVQWENLEEVTFAEVIREALTSLRDSMWFFSIDHA